MQFDIISTKDVYEDDNIVVMHRISRVFNAKVLSIDIGIKDEFGDIFNIITVKNEPLDID